MIQKSSPMKLCLVEPHDKANVFIGLIKYELINSLASHLVDYISVHIRTWKIFAKYCVMAFCGVIWIIIHLF